MSWKEWLHMHMHFVGFLGVAKFADMIRSRTFSLIHHKYVPKNNAKSLIRDFWREKWIGKRKKMTKSK